jgi:hypothetical protein
MTTIFLAIWPKLRFCGQNGQTKFDHDHSQNSKLSVVKMVYQNFIMTISTIPDFLLLKFVLIVEIVEISVNFDHNHLENPKVLWSLSGRTPPPKLFKYVDVKVLSK